MDLLPSTYLDEFITVALLQMIATASPGPDFAIVVHNSLIHSRRIGIYTALGITVGIFFHVALAMLGVGLILTQSIILFSTFKLLACAYLFYMAFQSLRSGKKTTESPEVVWDKRNLSPRKALQIGMVTNIMNPKCILFTLTLFTVVVAPTTPKLILFFYGMFISFITLVWFLTIALCFSHERVRSIFSNISHWINRFTAIIFIMIGLKILFDMISEL